MDAAFEEELRGLQPRIKAKQLRGENVDLTGSHFEQLEFEDTLLNSAG